MSSLPHVSPAVLEFTDNHGIAKRNLFEALLTHADWILTGTSTHPEQLSHALMNYATRKYDRLKLDPTGVEVLASILADIAVGIPPRLAVLESAARRRRTARVARSIGSMKNSASTARGARRCVDEDSASDPRCLLCSRNVRGGCRSLHRVLHRLSLANQGRGARRLLRTGRRMGRQRQERRIRP
jgi:hypothetical protein